MINHLIGYIFFKVSVHCRIRSTADWNELCNITHWGTNYIIWKSIRQWSFENWYFSRLHPHLEFSNYLPFQEKKFWCTYSIHAHVKINNFQNHIYACPGKDIILSYLRYVNTWNILYYPTDSIKSKIWLVDPRQKIFCK